MTQSAKSRAPRKKSPSVAAREAEAGDGYVTIEHRGISLKVPVGKMLPVAAFDKFLEGDNYEGTKLAMGAEQWKLLCDAGMTLGEIDELGAKLSAASGN